MSDSSEDCASEPGELPRFRLAKAEPGDTKMEVQEEVADSADDGDGERLLLPGDLALSDECSGSAKYVLGVGLRATSVPGEQARLEVRATRAGYLRSRGRSYWLDCPSGRYQQAKGDCVLGVVVKRAMAESVQVDVGCFEPAILSLLSFENATKRNRPDVRLGDLVYCRLIRCEPGLEPELSCTDSAGRAGGFGVVGRDSGALVAVPPGLAKRLVREQLLKLLAPLGPFEATVGVNGRVWLCGSAWQHTVALAGAVAAFHQRQAADCHRLVDDMQRAGLPGAAR